MKRDLAAENAILRRQVSHMREQLSGLKASELNTMIIRRENIALRERQTWLEARVVALELAAFCTLAT